MADVPNRRKLWLWVGRKELTLVITAPLNPRSSSVSSKNLTHKTPLEGVRIFHVQMVNVRWRCQRNRGVETPSSSIRWHGTVDHKGSSHIEGACKYNPHSRTINSSYGGSVDQKVDSIEHERTS